MTDNDRYSTVELNGRTFYQCPFHEAGLYPSLGDLEGHLDQYHSFVGRKR